MSYSFSLGDYKAGPNWNPYNAVNRWNTYKTDGNTTIVNTGITASKFRQQVFEDVKIPTYSTTTTVTGGVRSITNIDLQSTWGQPIPLLWGHTRVKALPIWAGMPEERTNGAARPPVVSYSGTGEASAGAG